jgi:hypothetical protein
MIGILKVSNFPKDFLNVCNTHNIGKPL